MLQTMGSSHAICKPKMALNGLLYTEVPLRHYSLTHLDKLQLITSEDNCNIVADRYLATIRLYLGYVFQQLDHGLAALGLGAFDAFQLRDDGVDLVGKSADRSVRALNSTVHQQRLFVLHTGRLAARLDLIVFRVQLSLQ